MDPLFLTLQEVAQLLRRRTKTLALNVPKTIPLLSVPLGFALLLAGMILMHFNGRRS